MTTVTSVISVLDGGRLSICPTSRVILLCVLLRLSFLLGSVWIAVLVCLVFFSSLVSGHSSLMLQRVLFSLHSPGLVAALGSVWIAVLVCLDFLRR